VTLLWSSEFAGYNFFKVWLFVTKFLDDIALNVKEQLPVDYKLVSEIMREATRLHCEKNL